MMKTNFLSFSVTCLFVAIPFSFAQISTPTAAPVPVIRTGATNVLVDVVVTDHHGVPVDNLKKDDFTVLENGQPQQIVSFESHLPPASAVPAVVPQPIAGVYTNVQAAPESAAVDVLLIDALNTPTESQAQSHRLLVQYLKTLPIGKPIAVFALNGQLRQLEDFTTDHTALLKAVEELTRYPQKSPLLKTKEDTVAEMKNEDQALELGLALRRGVQGLEHLELKNLQQFEAEHGSANDSLRVQYTLAAFDRLGRYLSGIPGRKNVIWISGSFPLSILPDPDLKNPFQAARDFSAGVDHTARLLANARVALYPIDARGLFPHSQSSVSVDGGSMARNPDRVAKAESAEFSRNAQEQLSLEEFARVTGGEAIYNTNDLKGALDEVDRNGSHYYSLAYAPSNKARDNKLRRIDIRVNSGKFHLSYRRSYTPTEALERNQAATDFASLLQHDVPPSTQILFRLTPTQAAPQPDARAAILGDNPNSRRPVTRFSIDWNVEVDPVVLTPSADGILHGSTTLLTIAYDRDGKALNSVTNTLSINVPSTEYPRFLKGRIRYRQNLDIPAQSAWLRAGILDPVSGHVGTLEIPFSVKTATH
jgi:VWFA-related protein